MLLRAMEQRRRGSEHTTHGVLIDPVDTADAVEANGVNGVNLGQIAHQHLLQRQLAGGHLSQHQHRG